MTKAEAGSVGILLSREMHLQLRERLQVLARASSRTLHFVIAPEQPGQVPEPAEQASIQAAYYSRDIMQGSTKLAQSPASQAFFQVLDTAAHIEWVHVCTAGVDMLPYHTLVQRGIRLTASSGSNARPVAQTVVGAVLAQSRGFAHWLDAQAQGRWAPLAPPHVPLDLEEQTAIIVGLGPIGREVGRLLKAVGLHTIGVRRSGDPVEHFDRIVQLDALDSLLPSADWLVLACPLTPETRGLAGTARLALLPARAGVVNVGRGELVDELALAGALQAGRLRSAYLDVFSTEPLPSTSPLWRTRNCWISPHNAAASAGNNGRVNEMFLSALRHWLSFQRTAPHIGG